MGGKTLRRSGGAGGGPVPLVSAWAAGHRLVLGQLRTAQKSHEPSGARPPKGGAFARRAAPEGAGQSPPCPSSCAAWHWPAALRLCAGP